MSLRLVYTDDLPEIFGEGAKSPLPVDMRRSKTSLLNINCGLEDVWPVFSPYPAYCPWVYQKAEGHARDARVPLPSSTRLDFLFLF